MNPNPPPGMPEPATEPEPIKPPWLDADLDKSYRDLSTLFAAGAMLYTTLELDELTKLLMETALQLARADDVSLMLVDESRGDLYIAGSSHLSGKVIAETRLKPGQGLAGWVVQNREAALLQGPLAPDAFSQFLPRPAEVGSCIAAPLIPPPILGQPQGVLGVLTILRSANHPHLTERELELVTAWSTQAAAALQKARLYKQLQRRTAQLEHLIEIERLLTMSLEMDAVLDMTVRKAMELLKCESASLLLFEEATGDLVFRVALGPAGPMLANRRLPADAGIAGSVFRTGVPLIVNDAKSDPRHLPDIDEKTRLITRALLCVPLKSSERTIGVIEVMNKVDSAPFDEADCESLAAFAIESTIAVNNAQLYSNLKHSFTDTVRVIANAVEARDPYTAGHSERVTRIAIEIARELGWTPEQIGWLEIGALLHDIGKIGVSDAILKKPTDLTNEEYDEMRQHPVFGAKMLESVQVLRPVLPFVLYHQERYDGTGYPFGLAGNQIPIEGRVLAIVDAWDAITSDRPYRKAMTVKEALGEIVRNRGTQFDPDVVDALRRIVERNQSAFSRSPQLPPRS